MKMLSTFVAIVLGVNLVQSARILGMIHIPSYSHQILFRPIWKELSLRGHQVTVITSNPMNDSSLTNLTEIDVSGINKQWAEKNCFDYLHQSFKELTEIVIEQNYVAVDYILSNPHVNKLIKDKNEHFDLLMIEGFHSATVAFSERFKCPFILMFSLDAISFAYDEIGNPSHPVLHPDYMLQYYGRLSFIERLSSVFAQIYAHFINYHKTFPNQQFLIKKHFGEGYSPIQELYRNYSMYFLNTNPVIHPIRPLLPNVIQIGGGTHLTTNTTLPEDLATTLNNCTFGAIYFSLGSNVKSNHISSETRQAILETFKELPYTVFWKFEDPNLPDKPSNVIISKWFPQQQILRHPNVKLFISQGGLQSLEEAIYGEVPILGIPIMGDQHTNIKGIVSKGYGLLLPYDSITKKNFKSAILDLMNNPRYHEKVKEIANILKDQMHTGLELAIWWTEYVLRHKGTTHFRNPALDLPWYQNYLLDVFGFCLTALLVVLFVLYRITAFLSQLSKRICKIFKQKQM
ncbi:hypothetical protein FQA39_LY02262 [Lamprigera yunnana]|nr:hypothetical protein FQA39_LY02262 [Lamprigera yunnana]